MSSHLRTNHSDDTPEWMGRLPYRPGSPPSLAEARAQREAAEAARALTAMLCAVAAGSVAERLSDTGQHIAAFSVLLALLVLVVYDVEAPQ